VLGVGAGLKPGDEVRFVLPDAETITGRVARRDDRSVAISFRQDPATLARIDTLLPRFGFARAA
jgi:hypothetical protein